MGNGTVMCKYGENRVCCLQEREIDLFFKMMDYENDIIITGADGIVRRISDPYEAHYGVTKNEVVGKSIYDLEKEGVFSPSVTVMVLKEKRKITIMQQNKFGDNILATGVPIFGDGGELKYVAGFNSLNIEGMLTPSQRYERLKEIFETYNTELREIHLKNMEKENLVASSRSMRQIHDTVVQIADTNANVVITGETGVGKSMIAKIIHKCSQRSEGPFVEINCGTIPESLIESELFGYEGGAFTGADAKGRMGKIESASGGTLFLDEIGELSLSMQIKFLHVIQDKKIAKIGGAREQNVDFRLIAATNRNLEEDVKNGRFREDLYYRINVIPISIPPIRERREDIVPLVMSFLTRFNKLYGKEVELSQQMFSVLEQQDWPGNIRQLENYMERLVIMAKTGTVEPEQVLPNPKSREENDMTLNEALAEYEKEIIVAAFHKYGTSIAVGRALGISQVTAARKLRKYLPGYAGVHFKNSR